MRLAPRIFTVLLLAAIGSILWSDGWDLTCRLDPLSRITINRTSLWDASLRNAAGGGGLFLKFVNFAPADRQSALEFYFRAVYLLYPQPVIVAPPSAAILLGWQLMEANILPDDAWLARHGIVAVEVVDGKSGVPTPQPPRPIAPAPPAPPPQSFSIIWCAIYLAALLLAGYAVVGWVADELTAGERFGLSAILGSGIFGFCLIALSMAGRKPSRLDIVILGVFFAVLAAIRRGPPTTSPAPQPVRMSRRFVILCAVLVGYGLIVVALDASILSTPIWDAFAIWQLKAKVLAAVPLYPRPPYFFDVRLSYSHLRYPLLWPMICAGIGAANGSLREGLGKLPAYLFYIGAGACIYGFVRRCRGRTAAIIAAGFVLTMPVIYRYGGSGTAEMALTAFYTASIICILRWQQQQRWGDLVLCALFSAAMTWTKNEGQALALINAIVILILSPQPLSRKNILATFLFAAIVLLLFAPWLLYIRPLPRSDEDYAGRLDVHAIASNLQAVPVIAWAMLKEVVNFKDWGIFWILMAAVALLRPRITRQRAIRTLWVLLVMQILAYFPPYMVTIWTLKPLLVLTIDRMFMHLLPAGALLIGLLWPDSPQWLERHK